MKLKNFMKISLFTIMVCLLLILIKNQYSPLLLTNSTYGIPALIKKGTIENLYIGSSMFRQGLDIRTLNEQGGEHYILAYNGNQPVLEYRQLQYLTEHGVTIKNLYIDMYVYSAWEAPQISDEKLFLEVDLPEKIQLGQLIAQNPDTTPEMYWRMFVTGNNELLFTWPLMSPILNSQFFQGGTLRETSPAALETLQNAGIPSAKGSMDPLQQEAIQKIIRLADEHDINLTFIETPKFITVMNDEEYVQAMNEYTDLLNQNNVRILTYSFDHSDPDNFMDLIHMSSEGRKTFSEMIR